MKILRITILFLIVLCVVVFAGSWYYVKANGKQLAHQVLTKAFKRPVLISEVHYIFPRSLSFDNIQIGNEFLAQKLTVHLGLNHLLKGNVFIAELICDKPILKLNKSIQSSANNQEDLKEKEDSVISASSEQGKEVKQLANIDVYIARAVFNDGKLHYQSLSNDKKFSFHLEDINLHIEKIKVPSQPFRSPFELTAVLQKEGSQLEGGQIKAGGWIDFTSKDLDASLSVTDKTDAVGLTAHAVAQSNDMSVNGEFKLNQVSLKPKAQNTSSVDDLIFGALSNAGVQMGAKFSFDTKMDDPKLTNVKFKGSIITQ